MEAELPEGWTLERIRELSQCPTADFMPTSVHVIVQSQQANNRGGPVHVEPELIIRFDDYALVKPLGQPDWYVGQVRGVDEIYVVSAGSDLHDALRRDSVAPVHPDMPLHPQGAARRAEIGVWSAAVVGWSLLWALILRSEGASAPGVGTHLLTWVAGLGVLAVAVGARQASRSWRLTLLYTAVFAVSAGFVLVLVIGPDSGTAGVCSPGEACDMEEGMGFFTGPLMLAVPLLAVMALARMLVSASRRIIAGTQTRQPAHQAQ
jgi:hypothetical protein